MEKNKSDDYNIERTRKRFDNKSLKAKAYYSKEEDKFICELPKDCKTGDTIEIEIMPWEEHLSQKTVFNKNV